MQAGGQRRGVSRGDAAGNLLQQGQLRWQHSLAAGPVLSLTQAAVPALPAMGRRAQEVRLGLHLLAAQMLSHMGRGRAAVCVPAKHVKSVQYG